MNIRHLKIFISVVENNTLTETAKKLHISQPSISLVISELDGY